MSIEAMKQALEALELMYACYAHSEWISHKQQEEKILAQCVATTMTLRQAIAEAENQEPVAWESVLGAVARGWCYEENANKTMDSELAVAIAKEVHALYTTPQQRKPLTDEIPKSVLLAISNAGLTLLKTQHGYELRKLGPIEAAHGIKE